MEMQTSDGMMFSQKILWLGDVICLLFHGAFENHLSNYYFKKCLEMLS